SDLGIRTAVRRPEADVVRAERDSERLGAEPCREPLGRGVREIELAEPQEVALLELPESGLEQMAVVADILVGGVDPLFGCARRIVQDGLDLRVWLEIRADRRVLRVAERVRQVVNQESGAPLEQTLQPPVLVVRDRRSERARPIREDRSKPLLR